jgi:hypothetical protein
MYPTAKRKSYSQSTTKCLSINPKAVINNLYLNFLFPQLDDIKRLQHYQSILLSSQAPTIPLSGVAATIYLIAIVTILCFLTPQRHVAIIN